MKEQVPIDTDLLATGDPRFANGLHARPGSSRRVGSGGPPPRRSPRHRRVARAVVAFAAAVSIPGCQDPRTPAPESTREPAQTTETEATGEAVPEIASAPAPDAEPDAAGAPALTPDGWGPLRIGMSRSEVVEAVGEDANPDAVGGPDPARCDEFYPARAPAGMMVMIEGGVLTRITLVRDSEVETAAGFGPGDAGAEIVAAYGDRAILLPHKYLPAPARYITIPEDAPSPPDARGIRYTTGTDDRVTHVHAGGPSIEYVEGCL